MNVRMNQKEGTECLILFIPIREPKTLWLHRTHDIMMSQGSHLVPPDQSSSLDLRVSLLRPQTQVEGLQ